MLTLEQLKVIMPQGGKKLANFVEPLNLATSEFNILSPLQQAAFIAQLAHESMSFLYMEEIANGSAYEKRKDLGNLEPEAIAIAKANGSTPGRWWKGHGPIQITGFYNHKACGKSLGLDLLNNPKLITQPLNGCRSASWFWKMHELNNLADNSKFVAITKIINGGTNGLDDRIQFYKLACSVLKCPFKLN